MKYVLGLAEVELTLLIAGHIVLCFTFVAKKSVAKKQTVWLSLSYGTYIASRLSH